MRAFLEYLALHWLQWKMWIVENTGLTRDALHVHGSVLLLFLVALLLRRRPDSFLCWLTVLIAELFNEYADFRSGNVLAENLTASWHDVYNTMFLPTVILFFGRLLFPPKAKPPPVEAATESPAATSEMLTSRDLADQSLKQAPPV